MIKEKQQKSETFCVMIKGLTLVVMMTGSIQTHEESLHWTD